MNLAEQDAIDAERGRKAIENAAAFEARLPIRQRILRCIWFDQSLTAPDRGFRTDDNQALTIFSPGWWNL